jgi:hypothetical protein
MAYGDLASLPDVRAWLKTDPKPYPATDDLLLARLITAASQLVQTWLNRPLSLAGWQETRDALGCWGGDTKIVFGVQPVSAVLLVVVDGVTVPPIPAAAPAPPGQSVPGFFASQAGYVFTPTALTIRGYWVPRKQACILLQYMAGFITVPTDIAQATIELVCRKYRERDRIGQRSKSIGGAETVAYETTMFSLRDFKSDIQLLLQQYRMVAPVAASPAQLLPGTLPSISGLTTSLTANLTLTPLYNNLSFDNYGATGPITITLPSWQPGLTYSFFVVVPQSIFVQASGADRIGVNGVLSSGLSSNMPYAQLTLATTNAPGLWVAESLEGAWG